MIRNYIKIALRNMWVNKTFSLINVIGLSVSMSLGLLIIVIVQSQYSFDRFHKDSERIYRVNTNALRTNGGTEQYASAPYPLGTVIKENYSFAEEVVHIQGQLNQDVVYDKVVVPVHGLFVDPSFLNVFNFKLEKGNSNAALLRPESLVLTQDAARKIFGNADPIDKTVELKGSGNFVVSGALAEFAGKTHFEFEVLASTNALPLLERQNSISATLNDWNNYYSSL